MSRKKDKANAYFQEKYNFVTVASVDNDKLLRIVDRAAETSASKINGAVRRQNSNEDDEGIAILFDIKVRLVPDIVKFTIVGIGMPEDKMRVELNLVSYTYQDGSFGMKPQIGGKAPLEKFISTVKAELGAA